MSLSPQDANAALVRLMTWLSPAFPTGSFAYSHGLEVAFDRGVLRDGEGLRAWLADLVSLGSGWADAVMAAESWRHAADAARLAELAEQAQALAGSPTRELETMAQGTAFLAAAQHWPGATATLPCQCPLPVAVGAVAGRQGVMLQAMLAAYLHAFISNQVQAALRLGRLGQQQGVAILAALEPLVLETAGRAAQAGIEALGSGSFRAEIMSLDHQTLNTRIFRS